VSIKDIPKDSILFDEKLPDYIFGTSYLYEDFVSQLFGFWVIRFLNISLFILIINLLNNVNFEISKFDLTIYSLVIIFIAVLYITEHHYKMLRLSSQKILISHHGIYLYHFYWERLFNTSGLIRKNDIRKIKIIRGRAHQILSWDPEFRSVKWKNAPIEIVVYTKYFRRHRSGYRQPQTILDIVDLISKEWNISVIDKGQGLGEFYYCKWGNRID